MIKCMNTFRLLTFALFLFASISFAAPIDDAVKALENEKFTLAKELLNNIIKSEPINSDAYYYLGVLSFQTAEFDQALGFFKKGKEVNPSSLNNTAALGMMELQLSKDTLKAIGHFEEVLTLSGDDLASAYVLIAHAIFLAKADYIDFAIEKIEAFYTKVKKDKKKMADKVLQAKIHLALGDAYAAKRNNNKAVENYNASIANDSTAIQPRMSVAATYLIVNKKVGVANYESLIALYPSYAPPYRLLAEFFYSEREYVKAADNYGKYLTYSEQTLEALRFYASALFMAGEYQKVIDLSQKAASAYSDNNRFLLLTSHSYYKLDNADLGIPAFESYFNAAPDTQETSDDYEYYAKLLQKSGKDSVAVPYLQKAFDADTSKTTLLSEIAAIYVKMKDYKNIIASYLFKESHKERLTATELYQLSKAYYWTEQFGKSDTTLLRLHDISPSYLPAYQFHAVVMSKFDPDSEKGLAKPYYEKVVELGQADVEKYKKALIEAYSYLGYIAFINKDNAASLSFYQKVLELDPENEVAKNAVKSL